MKHTANLKTPKPRATRKDKGTKRPLKGDRTALLVKVSTPIVARMDDHTRPGFSRSDIITEALGPWLDARKHDEEAI